MVDVLAVELSDALQQPQSFRATDPTLSQLTNEEIINFAFDTMNQYEQNQYVSGLIDDGRKNTIRILIQLLQFRVAYEQSRYDIASQLISTAQVIPLEGDIRHIQVYALQFETLADSIKKNIPELLLNIMDILYKIWAEYNNSNTLYVPESVKYII
jgi:nuclear pore complex protein Nup93